MRVRLAAVQYMLRHVADWSGFEHQVDFVLNAAADYQPQFVLLPELFTTQVLSYHKSDDIPAAVRELTGYTDRYVELMRSHAMRHGYYLVGGTHPRIHDGKLLNTSFLFTPGGDVHTQDKIHRTRWEKEKWHTDHGDAVRVFETPFGKIAILICYDIEFPELARSVADAGAEIVFVPSCTDDRQGFLRVRYCCHARAIENQIYVAMTSTVGNLPVAGLRLHYGQASIITPSDFPFARDGIAAEGVINEEQIIVADVDLALLDENRLKGTTIPLLDKRTDIYDQVPERVLVAG
ncbi:MAG: carbon-nitrogen hydrolase family protein [Sulfuritalea sp.]|nr:carbon-nitrogen hydrolase family protein [Sulfuritalea sp.]